MLAQDFWRQRVLATASIVVTMVKRACARWRQKDQRVRAQRSL